MLSPTVNMSVLVYIFIFAAMYLFVCSDFCAETDVL